MGESQTLTLTTEEILYLEETLRTIRNKGLPLGFVEGVDLNQALITKLEAIE